MPARNRVTPFGDIEALALRGAWTGNRGILHREREIVRFHAGDLWITCALQFRGRRSEQWRPRHFTWLFFHDEAVSFAAGHRPCAECRRADYNAFRSAWADAAGGPEPSAKHMNRQLHDERIVRGTHRRQVRDLPWHELPDGVFVVLDDGAPAIVVGDGARMWTPRGYGAPHPRPRHGRAAVLTPPSAVWAIRAGYVVHVDHSLPAETIEGATAPRSRAGSIRR